MVGKSEHTPKARALGAELRECRIEAGLTQHELAARIGVSHVSISRYETGTRSPRPEDAAQLLATLGVAGQRYSELVELARGAEQSNWLETGVNGLRRELMTVIEFERIATRIVDVETNIVPGLLQTADYARAIMGEVPGADLEARVALRVGRAAILNRKGAPNLVAIVSEVALRQRIGGAEVMVDQLRHLLKAAELPNVTIIVLPAVSERWHPAHAGAFILFEFPKGDPIVHLEHFASGAFLHAKEVAAYRRAVDTLQEVAMDEETSARLIATISDELEGTCRIERYQSDGENPVTPGTR
ncbi:helix-turn-helix transcriptional regulator [Saccharopolyspora sp. TS4A08]|uniref:Helix-turn-helix transcriptional regulator n=1 Tax=Saccharopolyspora ipomoeae TaxID=3042027 RepID=A0ABT6PKZ6_9PSEU|nr:helix-turn-helix transcriptional regulator [Saccharopolyspora sp. TS4A08]MDI2028629.1 helix-turn-helix transcriptional regulator [Saccharopolyspora sp. TS4A08]